MERAQVHQFAVEVRNGSGESAAQNHCPLGDRVENGLHVGRRPADDLQDVRRRGLLFERFLGLVEQPRVLDRYDCLVGECLQQV